MNEKTYTLDELFENFDEDNSSFRTCFIKEMNKIIHKENIIVDSSKICLSLDSCDCKYSIIFEKIENSWKIKILKLNKFNFDKVFNMEALSCFIGLENLSDIDINIKKVDVIYYNNCGEKELCLNFDLLDNIDNQLEYKKEKEFSFNAFKPIKHSCISESAFTFSKESFSKLVESLEKVKIVRKIFIETNIGIFAFTETSEEKINQDIFAIKNLSYYRGEA